MARFAPSIFSCVRHEWADLEWDRHGARGGGSASICNVSPPCIVGAKKDRLGLGRERGEAQKVAGPRSGIFQQTVALAECGASSRARVPSGRDDLVGVWYSRVCSPYRRVEEMGGRRELCARVYLYRGERRRVTACSPGVLRHRKAEGQRTCTSGGGSKSCAACARKAAVRPKIPPS